MYYKGSVYGLNDCDIIEAGINFGKGSYHDQSSKIIVYGTTNEEVNETVSRIIDELNDTKTVAKIVYTREQFAAAFNAWVEDYIHNPQGYEDSYETAMRHVSEKLKGEEASYGQVAAEVFQSYLDKLEDK